MYFGIDGYGKILFNLGTFSFLSVISSF